MPPKHTRQRDVVWRVSSHKCKCPQKMKEIMIRREQAMILYHLPGRFCNICWNTKWPSKADAVQSSMGENAKPFACPSHHLLPSFVDIINGHLLPHATEWTTQCAQQKLVRILRKRGGNKSCVASVVASPFATSRYHTILPCWKSYTVHIENSAGTSHSRNSPLFNCQLQAEGLRVVVL